MRGKVVDTMTRYIKYRITPAYAGKSGSHENALNWDGDHPRVCGEKAVVGDRHIAFCWITPAYAGKRKCAG